MKIKALSNSILVMTLSYLLTGCASTNNQQGSGFLSNYQQLKPLENYPNTSAYKADNFDNQYLKALNKIHIQPFEVWLNQDNLAGVNIQQMTNMVSYFQQQLKDKLSAHYQVVAVPDADTLTIRGAFTKAKTQSPDLSALDILPFRIVMNAGNAAYLTATGQKDVVTEVAIEAEFIEGKSNEVLFAMTANKELDSTVADSAEGNTEAVKQVLNEWATNFAKHIASVKQSQ